MNKKIWILTLVLTFIFSISANANYITFNENFEIPSIQFMKDNIDRTLTIASVDPSGVLWGDIDVDGVCDLSGLGTYVTAGDVIFGCYGTISFTYVPSGSVIGVWDFPSLSCPSISWVKDDSGRTLTIASVDPSGVLWGDIDVDGVCDLSGLGTYVTAGDVIFGCYGTISFTYVPSGSVIGVWDFPNEFSYQNDAPSMSYTISYIDYSFTVTSVDSGYRYSSSSSNNDANLVFVKNGVSYFVIDYYSSLTLSDSGSAVTRLIRAGDVISGFSSGTYSIIWKPTDDVIGVFNIPGEKSPSMSYTISYIDYSFTVTSVDSGYRYSSSSSNNDANLVFEREDEEFFVVNDYFSGLIISDSGFVATQLIRAGDVISGFSSGTYSIIWKPTDDVIGVFNIPEEETPDMEYGWIYGKVLLSSDGVTYPGKNLSVYILPSNIETSNTDMAVIHQKGNYYSTNETGQYMISNIEEGTYILEAIKNKLYKSSQKSVRVNGNEGSVVNFIIEISKTRLEVEKYIESGDIGGEINIEYNIDGNYGHDSIAYSDVVISNIQINSDKISLLVSGDEQSLGKTIAVTTDLDLFDITKDLVVKYDNETIRMADDIEDVLNPNDDGIHAEYLITIGTVSVEILVSIPHFSEHEITITSMQPEGPIEEIVESVGGINALILYIAMSAFVSILFIGSIFIRRRF